MRRLAVIATFATLAALPALAQGPAPPRGPDAVPDALPDPIPMGAIKWIDWPHPLEVSYIYDIHGHSIGSATIECTLNRSRKPRDCTVITEQYRRDGRRAMEMAKLFQATKDPDWAPLLIGKRVRFTFDFNNTPGFL